MLNELSQINWIFFFHIAGIIIALGAVTVIDYLGFISRKNKKLTQTTISAHHITKPLIWIGTILVTITWIIILINETFTNINTIKTIILIILILNGSFLSFYISPRLDELKNKNILLPKPLQNKIKISMIISFIFWWSFVILTIAKIT